MDNRLRIARDVELPLSEIELRVSRSSGPGGQHANVTASRVEASFDVEASATLTDEAQAAHPVARLGPVVRATAQDTRSQARNRELRSSACARAWPRRWWFAGRAEPTKPSRAARRRRLEGKRRRSA